MIKSPLVLAIIERIDNAATLPDDPPAIRLRKTLLVFLNVTAVLVVPFGAWFLGQAGWPEAALVAFAYALLSAVSLMLLLATKKEVIASWMQLLGLLFGPFLVQWSAGGFAASGAIIGWSSLAPLCALVFLGTRAAVLWFAGFTVLVFLAAGQDIVAGSDAQSVLLFCENTLLVSCLAFIALRFFIIERDKAQAALEREQERSENLLLNILPASIAKRLKDGQQTLADGFAEATVLFADLVGFTKMSAHTEPERIVFILNRLFSRFDQLSERFGIEKIKTIGDAYMVCAGVPEIRRDHAQAMAEMALAMQEAIREHNHEFASDLKLRIGINSGPVVAGVIGLKKFIYDLWGDTVNIASRMESSGLPDCIQVSSITRELLRDQYEFESRGQLEIKGIGLTEAWILKGRKVPA